MSEREAIPYDVLMKGLSCPRCWYPMTGHTTASDARPKHGDFSLCWYCEQLNTYRRTAVGWTLQMLPLDDLDPANRAKVEDLLGQLRLAKSSGWRPGSIGLDVADRDGQR